MNHSACWAEAGSRLWDWLVFGISCELHAYTELATCNTGWLNRLFPWLCVNRFETRLCGHYCFPRHAAVSEELAWVAHPGTGMLKVPGNEPVSVTRSWSPCLGLVRCLGSGFLPSTCATQLERGWRVQLFRGLCASLSSIQTERCQIQHPRLSHSFDYTWHFFLSFCQVFFWE